jgi:hypothetical protein
VGWVGEGVRWQKRLQGWAGESEGSLVVEAVGGGGGQAWGWGGEENLCSGPASAGVSGGNPPA